MESFVTEKLRNIVLLGHSSSGKTTLGEALLFASGAISRIGRTEDGNTVGDYEPEAIKRASSTQMSVLPCVWNGHKVTLLDTPGYFDFVGDAVSALRVADAAILVVAANAGVEVGTKQMWRRLRDLGLPAMVFVNKLDRENTDLASLVESLREGLGRECVALQLPIGQGPGLTNMTGLLPTPESVPDEAQGDATDARDQLAEAVAETDDDLATKYLEEGALSDNELTPALKKGVLQGQIVPVLGGSATKMVGIKEILDAVLTLLPSPAEMPPVETVGEGAAEELVPDAKGHLAASVFKTTADQYVGKLSFIRVYRGTLRSNSEVTNHSKGDTERIGQLFVPRGKGQEQVPELVAGDIGAVGRLSVTATGDTLGETDHALQLPGISFPSALFAMAVYPKTNADADKLSIALNRLVEEDPSLRFTRDNDTGEALLVGLGDAHVDLAVQRAQRKFGVNLLLRTPRTAYKETISKVIQIENRYKQQSGGHGHFAHINLRLEPLEHGKGIVFDTKVVGGSVPKEFFPAVEKGVRRAAAEGVLAGYPVVDALVVLYDGSYHPVDSASMDFDICGYFGFKKGFAEATPGLMEPIALLRVTTPEAYTGEIIGDLNSKRGRILGMQPLGDGTAVVEAHVPLAELQRYALDLRSVTQSRATYTIEVDHDEELPQSLAQKVIEQAKLDKEAARA